MSIANLETPAVLVDENIMMNNILSIQQKADHAEVKVRPHAKTHKSIYIANKQYENGAAGITVSKVSEALVFIEAGIPSITVAYPLVNYKRTFRLLKAATKKNTELNLIVDSRLSLQTIAKAAQQMQKTVAVYIKIDVGLHRCGLQPTDPLIIELAYAIQSNIFLIFKGILSHAGHAYGAIDRQQVKRIAKDELQLMRQAKKWLKTNGIEKIDEISVGATPTVLAADSLEGVTEIRPGNYVFMDRTPLRLDLIKKSQIALSVLTTIVSKNDHYYITDAGSKTLSSDRGAHGVIGMEGYGLAYPVLKFRKKKSEMLVTQLSEEHGFVQRRDSVKLEVGDKLRILPNHSCVIMNLVNQFYLTNNGDVLQKLPVDARGTIL